MPNYSDEPTHDEGIRLAIRSGPEEVALLSSRPVPSAGSSGSKPLAVQGYQTLIASYIFGTLEPEWSEQFEKRNAEYGEYDSELGTLGEMVEIHRKYKKLKRAFIEKSDISDWNETPREVAMDMIGHLYLLIAVIDEEADNGR